MVRENPNAPLQVAVHLSPCVFVNTWTRARSTLDFVQPHAKLNLMPCRAVKKSSPPFDALFLSSFAKSFSHLPDLMAPSALTLIRSAFLDRNEVSLGCLVPNPLEPGQDFRPLKPPVLTPHEVNTRSIQNFRESLGAGKHVSLRARLTHVFSATARQERKSLDELVARSATLYYLKQPSVHFEKLCDDDDTKEWIETVLKRFPIFLVTGFLTVTEAEVGRARQQSTEARVTVEVSASDVISPGAATIGDPADSAGVEFGVGSDVHSLYSFVAPGERIIGVQYRKLKFKRFSAVNLEKAKLKPNSWVMFLGDRSRKELRSGTADVLEANLEECLTLDDLELDTQEDEELNPVLEYEEFVFLDE